MIYVVSGSESCFLLAVFLLLLGSGLAYTGCDPLSRQSVSAGLLERVTQRWWLSHAYHVVDTELSWYFP